jgi:hypothetical protein
MEDWRIDVGYPEDCDEAEQRLLGENAGAESTESESEGATVADTFEQMSVDSTINRRF